ncbi:MAG TPA: UV DNA damage repair endonuclease UvsE [Candidatus Paceibacterota bacterium]|nr:UV DNA damage repair endonuclease UvsE [Verrucomicrobiota bacterium]HRY46720.1 UV DNA damage repair endonuclease UvsE [Candidatus Paceibacterota bacterium]
MSQPTPPTPRLGLCCQFAREPIKFRTTTAAAMLRLPRADRLTRLAVLCRLNADALLASLDFCVRRGIGAFRINSQILPVKTHPQAGYDISELPRGGEIVARFRECGEFAREHGLRLSFHPDQFVVLNSPNPKTLAHSLAELTYQAEVAEWVGADSINIHGGGAYGNKAAALRMLRDNIERLPAPVRSRLTLENDDKVYTPSDLLPVCATTGVPLVFDVHHHRCLPDNWSVEAATDRACATWNREPLFHISSPLEGWHGPRPERHHDYINPRDFPPAWKRLRLTVEVEAKAKELAVRKLLAWLQPKSH